MKVSVENIVKVAQWKLVGMDLSRVEDVCTKEQGLAVFAARFGVQIAPFAPISLELTRSHLAVCYFASSKEEITSVGYPAETIVGIAASTLMRNHAAFSLDKLIKHFDNALRYGIVSKGEIGELHAQIMLAEAFDRACSDNTIHDHIQGITVEDFFKSLLNESCFEEMVKSLDKKVWDQLKEGRIRMSQFIRATYTPLLNDVTDWFNRVIVCIGKYNQPGWDMLLPVKLGTKMSAWVFSVKNLKSISKHSKNAAIKSSFYTSRVIRKIEFKPVSIDKLKQKPHIHTPSTPNTELAAQSSNPNVRVMIAQEQMNVPYGICVMNLVPSSGDDAVFQAYMGNTATAVVEKYAAGLAAGNQKNSPGESTSRIHNYIVKHDSDQLIVHPSPGQVVVGIEGLGNAYKMSNTLIDLLKQMNTSATTRLTAVNIDLTTTDSVAVDPNTRRNLLACEDVEE